MLLIGNIGQYILVPDIGFESKLQRIHVLFIMLSNITEEKKKHFKFRAFRLIFKENYGLFRKKLNV